MKTLLAMMRYFHYLIGITAPDEKHERLVLLIWIAVALGAVSVAVAFTWFIVPRILH